MKKLLMTVLVASTFFASEQSAVARDATALVTAYAKTYGVPVKFALRMARIESGVRCGVGRRYAGPLQISYRTARSLGYHGSAKALHGCEEGTKWGMKHLAAAYRLAGGNERCAKRKHQGGLGVRCGRRP